MQEQDMRPIVIGPHKGDYQNVPWLDRIDCLPGIARVYQNGRSKVVDVTSTGTVTVPDFVQPDSDFIIDYKCYASSVEYSKTGSAYTVERRKITKTPSQRRKQKLQKLARRKSRK